MSILEQPSRPTPEGGISITDLLAELNGRVSYRILDYWIHEGTVKLTYPGHGSGTRRRVMPAEREAIFKLVDAYERAQHDMEYLRSGALFLDLLGWHDISEVDRSA